VPCSRWCSCRSVVTALLAGVAAASCSAAGPTSTRRARSARRVGTAGTCHWARRRCSGWLRCAPVRSGLDAQLRQSQGSDVAGWCGRADRPGDHPPFRRLTPPDGDPEPHTRFRTGERPTSRSRSAGVRRARHSGHVEVSIFCPFIVPVRSTAFGILAQWKQLRLGPTR